MDLRESYPKLNHKMSIMKIRMVNDPILREPTAVVSESELTYINSIIPDMIKTMTEEGGVGLAANQVGISMRFFIMRVGEDIKLYINPVILEMGELEPFEDEGCLSIPGTSSSTKRAKNLKLRYRNEFFDEIEEEFKDFSAAAVQHEIDHLDGKLYVDQLEPVRKMMVLKKHSKFIKMRGKS